MEEEAASIWQTPSLEYPHREKLSASFLIQPYFDVDNARSWGGSGLVYDAVVKVADEDRTEDFVIEAEVYKRLGRHPRILDVMMILQGSCNILLLERMSCSLHGHLSKCRDQLTTPLILKWADQLAEAFDFIHEKGVYQTDVAMKNVLIDRKTMDLKLCDFAGSSLDGQEPLVSPKTRAQAPWLELIPDISTDLFNPGTIYYEMCARHEVYPEMSDHEVEELFTQGQFPDTSTLVLGEIIQKCWVRSYASGGEIRKDVAILVAKL